jgi:predicted MFS family arabinose efflux permease
MLSGFLTLFMAFLLREKPIHGWDDHKTALLGLVLGSVGVGSTLGTLIGSVLKSRTPEAVVLVTLIADAAAAVYAALFFGLIPAMVLALTAGLTQSLGKLSLDAMIQRDIPEAVRTSVFSRSETLLQLSWVVGGLIAVIMPLVAKVGLFTLAGLMVAWSFVVLRGLIVGRNAPVARYG